MSCQDTVQLFIVQDMDRPSHYLLEISKEGSLIQPLDLALQ